MGASAFLGVSFFFALPAYPLLQVNRILLVEDYEALGPTGGEDPLNEERVAGFERRSVEEDEAFRGKGGSLALEFDVATPGTLLYAGIPIPQAARLSQMRYLSFWMKTEGRPSAPKAEFWVEAREGEKGVRVRGRPFSRGRPAGGWQKFVVPLERFRGVTAWEQVTEIRWIFKNLSRLSPGKLRLDDFLFGSVYPDGFLGKEIPMQNRVSSFKIAREIAKPEMTLKANSIPVTLTLTFVDPYLEEIRFEESRDEGGTWRTIQSFHEHGNGGVYETTWEIPRRPETKGDLLLRAVGMNLLGGEVPLAGPHRFHID